MPDTYCDDHDWENQAERGGQLHHACPRSRSSNFLASLLREVVSTSTYSTKKKSSSTNAQVQTFFSSLLLWSWMVLLSSGWIHMYTCTHARLGSGYLLR